jgi:superfamily II DNA or RNA helicase
VLATSQYAKEGLDIPALDTLFLATPMGDVEQAVGRILRPFEGKKDPVVVDFRDDKVTMFARMGEMRDKLYLKMCS